MKIEELMSFLREADALIRSLAALRLDGFCDECNYFPHAESGVCPSCSGPLGSASERETRLRLALLKRKAKRLLVNKE